MKELIDKLSKSQIRYIYEMIRQDHFEIENMEVIVKPSNVNYLLARELLVLLAEASEVWSQKIEHLAGVSKTEEGKEWVMAWEPGMGEVIVTGIISLTYYLLRRTNRQAKEDEIEEQVMKMFRDPSPELAERVKAISGKVESNRPNLDVGKVEQQTINIILSKYNFSTREGHFNIDKKNKDTEGELTGE